MDIDIDMIYYINLDKRKNRRDHLEEQFNLARISLDKVTRFSAIDGETYEFSSEEKILFLSAKIQWEIDPKIAHKIMGNQLSHYYIWKDMLLKKYKKILIIQDDVIFCPNFISHFNLVSKSIPDNAEIINIGFHEKAFNSYFKTFTFTSDNDVEFLQEQKVNENVCKLKKKLNPCSLAYILTDLGARSISSHFTFHGFLGACDCNLNKYLISKDIFYGSRKVLCSGNANLPSDIFPYNYIYTNPIAYIFYFLLSFLFLVYVLNSLPE